MAKNQETIADIVGEIRQRASFANSYGDDSVVGDGELPKFLWDFADRIEAAARRETHWDDSETLKNAIAENANLKARLRAIKDAVEYDCECGSCGAYTIDCDVYRDSWFDGIGESEVAK